MYLFILCVCVEHLHVCIGTTYMSCIQGGQKMAPGPMLELQPVVPGGDGDQAWPSPRTAVLCTTGPSLLESLKQRGLMFSGEL